MIFKIRIFFYSTISLLLLCASFSSTHDTSDDLLRDAYKMTEILLEKCLKQSLDSLNDQVLLRLQGCLKRRSLLALDRLLTMDRIKISDGVDLVKYTNFSTMKREFQILNKTLDEKEIDWRVEVIDKIGNIFRTHILEITTNNEYRIIEGRHRHHNHMMPVLIFGTLAITMIAIPLGFQFLAVLGGKALLLAKLALILTSIQGLKKIATSDLNYGLYHVPTGNVCIHNNISIDCKLLDESFDGTIYSDNIYANIQFEDNSLKGYYDRRWYYDANDEQQGHQGYNLPDIAQDLLHPFSPRIQTAPNTYE